MIVRKKDRVVVLGITGKQGTFWTEKMIAYGTKWSAGVNPKRAGETHVGVPIFASTAEAAQKVGADVAVRFIPPPMAKDAAVAAAEAGVKLLVVLTEHIPAQDVMAMHAAAAKHGTRIVGPNTAGLVTPGECFVGIMPAFVPSVFKPGRVGVISRSGSLGTLVASISRAPVSANPPSSALAATRCSAPRRATRSSARRRPRHRRHCHRRRDRRRHGGGGR